MSTMQRHAAQFGTFDRENRWERIRREEYKRWKRSPEYQEWMQKIKDTKEALKDDQA